MNEDKTKHKGSENLIPVTERTKEEAREISSRGGKASGKARREKKNLKEIAKMFLDSEVTEQEKEIVIAKFPQLKDEPVITNAMVMVNTQLLKAKGGDNDSFRLLESTSGQKPRDIVENIITDDVTVILEDEVTDEIEPIYDDEGRILNQEELDAEAKRKAEIETEERIY